VDVETGQRVGLAWSLEFGVWSLKGPSSECSWHTLAARPGWRLKSLKRDDFMCPKGPRARPWRLFGPAGPLQVQWQEHFHGSSSYLWLLRAEQHQAVLLLGRRARIPETGARTGARRLVLAETRARTQARSGTALTLALHSDARQTRRQSRVPSTKWRPFGPSGGLAAKVGGRAERGAHLATAATCLQPASRIIERRASRLASRSCSFAALSLPSVRLWQLLVRRS